MKIFFSSPGRRFELIRILKKEIKNSYIIAGDHSKLSPTFSLCDQTFKLPSKIDSNYFEEILKICKKKYIDLVIPLIDYELEGYARFKNEFNKNQIQVMISPLETINLSIDKYKTFLFLDKHKTIHKPHTDLLEKYNKKNFKNDLVIIKPRKGSNSKDIHKIRKDFVFEFSKIKGFNFQDYIVQEYVEFDYETTVDICLNSNHKIIELCQRRRLKVRGGEVERAITTKNKEITEIIRKLTKIIKFFGIINIQIMTKDDRHYICEINPRFGGGFPLSYHSGANMIDHLKYLFNNSDNDNFGDSRYKTNFLMLRYDDAVYKNHSLND